MFTRAVSAALASLLPVATALAGGIGTFAGGVNIDFNVTSGAGVGQPTILFGGAAGQGGYWNPLNPTFTSATSRTIRNLANSADAVTLTFGGATTLGYSFNNANTSGDTDLLIDDTNDIGGTGATVNFTIGPFAAGVYSVYTYAVAPDNATYRTSIEAGTSLAALQTAQNIGGVIPAGGGGALTQGVAYALHTVSLTADGPIVIRATTTTGFGSVNGIQIKPVPSTRLYVNSAAPAAGQNGLSWAHAYQDLQSALAVAATTFSVTEIWVAGGTHRPDRVLYAANDRLAIFQPRAGLSIYGSFAGTEATLADRTNLAAHPTILSADLGVAGVNTDNAYHLMYGPAAGALTLDGLVLADSRRTFEDAGSPGGTDGSALHVGAGAAVIRNCTFRDCTGIDAALVIEAGGSVTVTDSVFERNSSARTTALWVSGAGASATVDRCIFRDHTMVGAFLGGLIECDGATLTLANSLIHDNNRRTSGAGMFMLGAAGGNTSVYNCTFANNTGGGIYLTDAAVFAGRNLILWGNRRAIDPSGTIEDQQVHTSASVVDASFTDSIIEGYSNTRWIGLANNGLDPRFIDVFGPDGYQGSSDDNFRPASRSPARDSAWYGGTPVPYRTLDLLKNPRIIDDPYFPNTGFDSSTNPLDRGCYEAVAASAVCPGDVGSQGGIEGPDGLRDNNDFIVYINFFFAFDPRADLGRTGGVPPGEGLFDNNDFIVYINLFFTACP